MWSYPRNLPFCYPPPPPQTFVEASRNAKLLSNVKIVSLKTWNASEHVFEIGKGNLKKDFHKREVLGSPRPSPLLTLALFTHFLVSQGSEFKERAPNYHFICTKNVKKYLFSQKIQ